MKRKLFAISLVLALLASAYAAYACLSTRGIRVYLMGTRMGAVLAGTWQLALLAAVILWIPAAITLIRKVRSPVFAPHLAQNLFPETGCPQLGQNR